MLNALPVPLTRTWFPPECSPMGCSWEGGTSTAPSQVQRTAGLDGVKLHPMDPSCTPTPSWAIHPSPKISCKCCSLAQGLARPSKVKRVLLVSAGMIPHHSWVCFKPQTHPSSSPVPSRHLQLAQGDAQPKHSAVQVICGVPVSQGGLRSPENQSS